MAFNILSSLDLDKEPLNGKLILIKEMHGIDASFFYSCFMSKQIQDKEAICLITVQNHFSHYHNVGLKMGYNLKNLTASGSFINIDMFNVASNAICVEDKNAQKNAGKENQLINYLFDRVKDVTYSLMKNYSSICVIIDDIVNLFYFNIDIIEINQFIQKCRNLSLEVKNCSFVFGVHVISETDPSYMISQLISHIADLICEVSALKTGRSVDVSGSFKVIRPWYDSNVKNVNRLINIDRYLFKLFDKGIKVFAPGSK